MWTSLLQNKRIHSREDDISDRMEKVPIHMTWRYKCDLFDIWPSLIKSNGYLELFCIKFPISNGDCRVSDFVTFFGNSIPPPNRSHLLALVCVCCMSLIFWRVVSFRIQFKTHFESEFFPVLWRQNVFNWPKIIQREEIAKKQFNCPNTSLNDSVASVW